MTSRFLPEWLGRAGTGFVEGEGVESFCLRDAEFKILVRNGNVDIQEAVENSHLAFGERLGLERNSGIIRKLGALTSVCGGARASWRGELEITCQRCLLLSTLKATKAGPCLPPAWLGASTWHVVGAQ